MLHSCNRAPCSQAALVHRRRRRLPSSGSSESSKRLRIARPGGHSNASKVAQATRRRNRLRKLARLGQVPLPPQPPKRRVGAGAVLVPPGALLLAERLPRPVREVFRRTSRLRATRTR